MLNDARVGLGLLVTAGNLNLKDRGDEPKINKNQLQRTLMLLHSPTPLPPPNNRCIVMPTNDNQMRYKHKCKVTSISPRDADFGFNISTKNE